MTALNTPLADSKVSKKIAKTDDLSTPHDNPLELGGQGFVIISERERELVQHLRLGGVKVRSAGTAGITRSGDGTEVPLSFVEIPQVKLKLAKQLVRSFPKR